MADRRHPDYTAMSGGPLISALGDAAEKWAEAFRQHAIALGYSNMDLGWLTGWFANAIEGASDVRRQRATAEKKVALDALYQALRRYQDGSTAPRFAVGSLTPEMSAIYIAVEEAISPARKIERPTATPSEGGRGG